MCCFRFVCSKTSRSHSSWRLVLAPRGGTSETFFGRARGRGRVRSDPNSPLPDRHFLSMARAASFTPRGSRFGHSVNGWASASLFSLPLPTLPPALRSPLEDTMAPLNVADLESRVRRRLAVTQRLAESAGDGPADPESRARSVACRATAASPSPKPPWTCASSRARATASRSSGLYTGTTARACTSPCTSLSFVPASPSSARARRAETFTSWSTATSPPTVAKPPPRGKDVQTSYQAVKTLSPGDTFGEVALLHSVPRSATVSAADCRAKVWALDRSVFSHPLRGGVPSTRGARGSPQARETAGGSRRLRS